MMKSAKNIQLPAARLDGDVSVEKALMKRRSIRGYRKTALRLATISQLLWSAQGVTRDGRRTSPSAGALYPLELYLVSGWVDDLAAGVYKYTPHAHDLTLVREGDRRSELCRAALGQSAARVSPAAIVFTSVHERVTDKYRDRGVRYIHIEVGCAAENLSLQAAALGLGTVHLGAFRDDAVGAVIGCAANERPLYIMPVGEPSEPGV